MRHARHAIFGDDKRMEGQLAGLSQASICFEIGECGALSLGLANLAGLGPDELLIPFCGFGDCSSGDILFDHEES